MRSVLITGATGGVGMRAVEMLREDKVKVLAMGRNTQKLTALARLGAQTYVADLVDFPQRVLEKLMDFKDAVWHCAALAAPWGNSEEFDAINVQATKTLFCAAASAGVPSFVYLSTPSLYFDFQHRRDVTEDFKADKFASHYAESKAKSELELLELAAKHPRTKLVILRPRVILGKYDQVLFPRVMRLVTQNKGRLLLPNGGNTTLDLCYVDNVVHAMKLATKAKNITTGATYNITNDEPVVLKDVLVEFFNHLEQPLQIGSLPYGVMSALVRVGELVSKLKEKEPPMTRHSLGGLAFDMTLSIDKAKHELGYKPLVNMADAIRQTALAVKARN